MSKTRGWHLQTRRDPSRRSALSCKVTVVARASNLWYGGATWNSFGRTADSEATAG